MYLVYPRSHNHETTAKVMITQTIICTRPGLAMHNYMFVQNINKLNKMSDHIGNLTTMCAFVLLGGVGYTPAPMTILISDLIILRFRLNY